jgi:hypothetical protein
VIVLALIMGLVFGGLRVASAADSAAEFGRVSQLASLGQQVTRLVQALQDERDETTGVSSGGNPGALKPWYHKTDAAAARVRRFVPGEHPGQRTYRADGDQRPRGPAQDGPG